MLSLVRLLDALDPLTTDLSSLESRRNPCLGCDSGVVVLASESTYKVIMNVPGATDFNILTRKVGGKQIIVEADIDPLAGIPEEFKHVVGRLDESKFVHAIAVASDANLDEVKADYKDGVLTLTIPRDESAKPRKIEVTRHNTPESE